MFYPEVVIMLHDQRTCSYMILRGVASITDKLDIPWDPGSP